VQRSNAFDRRAGRHVAGRRQLAQHGQDGARLGRLGRSALEHGERRLELSQLDVSTREPEANLVWALGGHDV
jgi:hypothetical protein